MSFGHRTLAQGPQYFWQFCVACLRERSRGAAAPYGVYPFPDGDGLDKWTAKRRAGATFG